MLKKNPSKEGKPSQSSGQYVGSIHELCTCPPSSSLRQGDGPSLTIYFGLVPRIHEGRESLKDYKDIICDALMSKPPGN